MDAHVGIRIVVRTVAVHGGEIFFRGEVAFLEAVVVLGVHGGGIVHGRGMDAQGVGLVV